MLRILMYVGESSMYGRKLVNMCHGSKASMLPNAYTGNTIKRVKTRFEKSCLLPYVTTTLRSIIEFAEPP